MSSTTDAAAQPSTDESWVPKRRQARTVRALVVVVPFVVSFAVGWAVRPYLPHPPGWFGAFQYFVPLIAISAITALLVERLAQRLLPLATLLELSLVFPDRVPSRFGLALRAGSTRRLAAEVCDVRQNKFSDDDSRAAQQILTMMEALRRHEPLTRGHTERVRAYSDLIAAELGLGTGERETLQWAVLLHDIGKLTVPAELLNKNGAPTADEWEIIKQHPVAGAAMAEPLRGWLGDHVDAAGQHHERFDGTGYPNGLSSTDISLAGRIVAVADAYDVITSKRSYKSAMSHEAARTELVRCAGTHFDPRVVKAMLQVSVGKISSVPARFSWLLHVPSLLRPTGAALASATVAVASLAAPLTVPEPLEQPPIELAFSDEGVASPSPTPAALPTTTPVPEPIAPVVAPFEPSVTPDPTPTPTQEPEATPQPAAAPTQLPPPPAAATPLPTATPEPTAAPTPLPTATPEPTAAPTPSAAPTPTAAPTATPEPTATPTPTAAPTPTATPLPTATPEPTATPIPLTPCEQANTGETSLAGLDLSGCSITLPVLDSIDLSGADLSYANLTNTQVSNFNLEGANLQGANLQGASFANGSMVGANLTDAYAPGVVITNVDIAYTTLTGAVMSSSFITDSSFGFATLLNTNFSGSVLSGVNFNDANISGADFSNADLAGTEFWRTVAHGVNLANANIAWAVFGETDLTGALGSPISPDLAVFNNATCPDATPNASACWV